MRKRLLCSGAAAVALLVGGSALANEELLRLQADPAYWPMQNRDYHNTRYSPLAQINTENAKDLQVAWTFSTGVLRGHEGGPLVIGDVMYIHTPFPNIVYALDLNEPGRIIWKYEPKQDPNVIPVMCCDTVNRGVAYADGKIFLHQADTTLVALDAKTGQVLWQAKNGDPSKGETGTSAPMVYKDKVYVGISGGEFGVRCHLTAYDINTGNRVWRAYSMGPDDEILFDPEKTTELGKPVGKDSSLKTWEGDQWQLGGGCTWGWISVDPELNLVYYGSGNPGTWNPVQRPGDNKWSMTIFARDADTGMAKWVYQMTPHDEWDYDGINEMVLFEAEVDGKMRKLLFHVDRNGFNYTLDRETGELLVAEKAFPWVNWATKIDLQTGLPERDPRYSTHLNGEDVNTTGICPAALGTKDQQPAAWNPDLKLMIVPYNTVCMDYEPFRVSYTAGQPYVGATVRMYPAPGSDNLGAVGAWDPIAGQHKWVISERFSVWSGVLTTAGGIAAYGTLDGHLKVVNAATGELLYKFRTPSGIIGNVMTYLHGGKQYIAVYSGVGGWAGIGLAAGLTEDTAGLGAVGAYRALSQYTNLGGQLTVWTLRD